MSAVYCGRVNVSFLKLNSVIYACKTTLTHLCMIRVCHVLLSDSIHAVINKPLPCGEQALHCSMFCFLCILSSQLPLASLLARPLCLCAGLTPPHKEGEIV